MEFKSEYKVNQDIYNLLKTQVEKEAIINLLQNLDITKLKQLVKFEVETAETKGLTDFIRQEYIQTKTVRIKTSIIFDSSTIQSRCINRNQRIKDLNDVVDTYVAQKKIVPQSFQDEIEEIRKEIEADEKLLNSKYHG